MLRAWLDRFLTALVRLVLRIFFREVEVVGLELLPRGVPLVLVSNHVNGLIDPLLLLGPLPVLPRFLGKSTLWKNPLIRPWAELAGAIPVYRKQDEGSGPSKNAETFARSHELLAQGGSLALFPEGKSHDEPELQPLKTGAARIVLGAMERFGDLGIRIVPVGLIFDSKQTFRSRALVQVGEPIDPSVEWPLYEKDGPEAVRALTARVQDALRDVTVNYPSWEEERLIARAADLYGRPRLDLPRSRRLGESAELHRAFLEGYRDLRQRFPERLEAVAGCVREYDQLLRKHRLRDTHVAAVYPTGGVLRFVGRMLFRLLVYLPVAVVGTILNWPPYRIAGEIARWAVRTADQKATYKVFGSLFLFPLTWIAESLLATRYLGGWPAGVLVFLIAPLTGYAALFFHDSRVVFWRESRAFLLLKTRKDLAAELRKRREEVFRGVEELVDLWQSGRAMSQDA